MNANQGRGQRPSEKWDRCGSCDAGTLLRWSADHDAWFCWSCWDRIVTSGSASDVQS